MSMTPDQLRSVADDVSELLQAIAELDQRLCAADESDLAGELSEGRHGLLKLRAVIPSLIEWRSC